MSVNATAAAHARAPPRSVTTAMILAVIAIAIAIALAAQLTAGSGTHNPGQVGRVRRQAEVPGRPSSTSRRDHFMTLARCLQIGGHRYPPAARPDGGLCRLTRMVSGW